MQRNKVVSGQRLNVFKSLFFCFSSNLSERIRECKAMRTLTRHSQCAFCVEMEVKCFPIEKTPRKFERAFKVKRQNYLKINPLKGIYHLEDYIGDIIFALIDSVS